MPIDELTPDMFSVYLTAARWTVLTSDDRRTIWEYPNGDRVFIPGAKDVDFRDLAARAVERIAEASELPPEDIFHDLLWSRFDRLFLRRQVDESSLVLEDAIGLHEALRDTISAAARGSVTDSTKGSFTGRTPIEAAQYVDQVRLIPSIRGSFILRALLPLAVGQSQPDLPLVGPADPKVRAISESILSSTAAALDTAGEVAAGAPLEIWTSAVANGVSSNLCDALARLPGTGTDSGNAELRIDWTWVSPQSDRGTVTVTPGIVPILEAGSAFLKGTPDEETIHAVGPVTNLHRELSQGAGEITVKGFIDGWSSSRAIRFEVDEDTYRTAVTAHYDGQSVRVIALVRREPTRLVVVELREFVPVFATQ